MAGISKIGLRNFWLQFHKWLGLLLAVLIIPLSLTGSALVWHDGLDKLVNPGRYAVSAVDPRLQPEAYANAARAVLAPGERISSIRFEPGEPVVVTAAQPAQPNAKGRPVRTMLWLDPADAKVLDQAPSSAGLVRVLHNLHGHLMIPGVGRQVVGWLGVAMLISCVSGIWLWWPTVGSWLRGLRWRRHRNFDTNLHHLFGFWIAVPLFILSLTGAWISFPKFFAPLGGDKMEQRGRPGADPMARFRAQPLDEPVQPLATVVRDGATLASGRLASIEWPTDQKAEWSLSFVQEGAPPRKITVDDANGVAKSGSAREQGETTARLMRRIHDGTGMGLLWQVIIFLGGILPAILAVTGIIMWWRARQWRSSVQQRQEAKRALADT